MQNHKKFIYFIISIIAILTLNNLVIANSNDLDSLNKQFSIKKVELDKLGKDLLIINPDLTNKYLSIYDHLSDNNIVEYIEIKAQFLSEDKKFFELSKQINKINNDILTQLNLSKKNFGEKIDKHSKLKNDLEYVLNSSLMNNKFFTTVEEGLLLFHAYQAIYTSREAFNDFFKKTKLQKFNNHSLNPNDNLNYDKLVKKFLELRFRMLSKYSNAIINMNKIELEYFLKRSPGRFSMIGKQLLDSTTIKSIIEFKL